MYDIKCEHCKKIQMNNNESQQRASEYTKYKPYSINDFLCFITTRLQRINIYMSSIYVRYSEHLGLFLDITKHSNVLLVVIIFCAQPQIPSLVRVLVDYTLRKCQNLAFLVQNYISSMLLTSFTPDIKLQKRWFPAQDLWLRHLVNNNSNKSRIT